MADSKKKASRHDTCMRWWAKTSCGKIVRGLWVNRFDEEGNETVFNVLILPNNDPRPKGVHLRGPAVTTNDFLATFGVGKWTSIVF